ncbi:MAG: 2-hydroxychromene-2-carboxylate isomerase family protein [Burkholderiaceae bacterium]|jgi:2-hydroxychromene-2-carboxylate isomerase|nr:MAG: 2-hydroxychromene-2-carboxylate isomerase family protein [Burkholderiaceae bacterium]
MKTLEFLFDVGSAASYLAYTQIPKLARETGAMLEYRPMLLGAVFKATGNRSPVEVPAKGRYTIVDFARFAKRYRIAIAHNPFFPINTLTLQRGATALQLHEPTRLVPYLDAVFRAIWVDGKNMNDAATVAAVLGQAGFDPAALLEQTQEPQVKDRLKAVTQDAIARGVFGAPTFFVGEQMFWGQDRLDFVKEALQS